MIKVLMGFFITIIGVAGIMIFDNMFIMASLVIVALDGILLILKKSWIRALILISLVIVSLIHEDLIFMRFITIMAMLIGIKTIFVGYGE